MIKQMLTNFEDINKYKSRDPNLRRRQLQQWYWYLFICVSRLSIKLVTKAENL